MLIAQRIALLHPNVSAMDIADLVCLMGWFSGESQSPSCTVKGGTELGSLVTVVAISDLQS